MRIAKIVMALCVLSLFSIFDCLAHKKVRRVTFVSKLGDSNAEITIRSVDGPELYKFSDSITVELKKVQPHFHKKRKQSGYVSDIMIHSQLIPGMRNYHSCYQQGVIEFVNQMIDTIDDVVLIIKSSQDSNDSKANLIIEVQEALGVEGGQ